jgi:hypothetical protein
MKTHVIQLEPHDDLISIRDKMDWAKAQRILLLWPHGRDVSVRPLDLALLQRHAVALGAELGLVTHSGDIRRVARQLAMPVFDTSAEAQRGIWLVRRKPKPERKLRRTDLRALRAEARQPDPLEPRTPLARLGVFASGVLSTIVLMALFLPSARIDLSPTTHTQSITLPINASPGVTSVFLSGNLPAHSIEVTVQGSKSAKPTGAVQSPDKPAQGVVRFRNITDKPLTIPVGTVVRTLDEPGVRFATQVEAAVEGGSGKTADAAVSALDFGTIGNLKAGEIQAIEGSLGLDLTVTNPEPTSGGTDRSRLAPNADDRARLHDALMIELGQQALDAMRRQLASGDVLFPDTLTATDTLVETYTPVEGQVADELSLTMQAAFQAYYAAEDDLAYLAHSALDAALPPGFEPDSNSLKLAPASALFSGPDGSTRFQLRIERAIRARIDPGLVMRLVRGRLVTTASERLTATFTLAKLPQIEMSPSWWPWLPMVPFRITVN